MSDASKIPNGVSEPVDVEGASARVRTQSECSFTSDDGNSNPTAVGKSAHHRSGNSQNGRLYNTPFAALMQRTTSQTFMVTSGLTSASPPKFVSLEEIMQAANGMKDMALVHQIVVDKDFKLERYEPEPDSIQGVIKNTMHRAYWDLLREDFAKDPPEYSCALTLLTEIKEALFNLLLPQHTKLRQQISEVLDKDLISQQAEKGVLDFKYYAQYVTSVMSKLCAPVRDENIKELTERTDVIDTFRGIFETLDLMALDMANFTINMAKPEIIAHSVQLERKKFSDYLAIQPDGLEFTRKWLLKHLDPSAAKPSDIDRTTYVRNLTKETAIRASIELLEWDINEPYPETFMLDAERLRDLQLRTERIIVIGTVVLITMSNVGSDLNTLTSFKQAVKEHSAIIMQTYTGEKDLKELLPNIAVQVIKDVKDAQKEHGLSEITDQQCKNLEALLLDVASTENKIRSLVKQRVKEFFQQIIGSSTAAPQKVPSGLTSLQKELTGIAGQFLKIISHNSTVFCIYYYDIIDAALPATA